MLEEVFHSIFKEGFEGGIKFQVPVLVDKSATFNDQPGLAGRSTQTTDA